jgi:hypothetical protein
MEIIQMNPINSQDNNISAPTAVNPINKNKPLGTEDEKNFSKELKDTNNKERLQNDNTSSVTPQELRQQITDSIVQKSIEKSLERAKEIGKELKE